MRNFMGLLSSASQANELIVDILKEEDEGSEGKAGRTHLSLSLTLSPTWFWNSLSLGLRAVHTRVHTAGICTSAFRFKIL